MSEAVPEGCRSDAGLCGSSDGVKDSSLKAEAKDSTGKAKAKTKDFKIVPEDPRGLQHCVAVKLFSESCLYLHFFFLFFYFFKPRT